jgi:hypothetical protein
VTDSVRTPKAVVTADLGQGAQVVDALSWQVSRDLTGSLPGQVRQVTGFSLGSGSVALWDSTGRTPWRGTPEIPGGTVSIDAATDAAGTLTPVARMVTGEIGRPSLLSGMRDVSIEDVPAQRTAGVVIPSTLALTADVYDGTAYTPLDAAWVVDQSARSLGYYACPQPTASAVLVANLIGSPWPEVGSVPTAGGGWSSDLWQTDSLGRVFPGFNIPYFPTAELPASGGSWYLTSTATRYFNDDTTTPTTSRYELSGTVAPGDDTSTSQFFITVDAAAGTFKLDVTVGGSSAPTASGTWTGSGIGADRRFQVQFERLSSTQARLRVRPTYGATWSAWATSTHVAETNPIRLVNINGGMFGVQVHTADVADVWTAATARIGASENNLTAVLVDSASANVARDAWQTAQEVAAASLSALWINEEGTLRFAGRRQMRGLPATLAEEDLNPWPQVYVAPSFLDLPYSVSVEDVADRVAVTYQPPDITDDAVYSTTVWESSGTPVRIAAGKKVTLFVDLDGAAADDLAPWYAINDEAVFPNVRMSRWAASTQQGGGGTAPPKDALDVTASLIAPSRIRLVVRNTYTQALWTAGDDPTMKLTVRARTLATFSNPVTYELGASEVDARTPLEVNLGAWCQDEDTAREIATWLQDMTTEPLPVLRDVPLIPDLSIRLGQIVVVRDPGISGLVSKALIAGLSVSHAADGLAMTARLVLLPVTESDVAYLYNYDLVPHPFTEGDIATAMVAALGAPATEADVAAWYEREAVPHE